MDHTLLTVDETVAYLRLANRRALYRLRQRHGLPVVKVGGSLRIPADQLEQWLQQRTEARTAVSRRGETTHAHDEDWRTRLRQAAGYSSVK